MKEMDEMHEQQVPNLEEMDEQEASRFLTELLSNLIPEEEYNVRHQEDYVLEMPQSGERIRGRERMREFQEAYPTPPRSGIRLRRVLVKEGLWVVEGVIDYGVGRQVFDVVLILELRDGKMWRDRWYFAEPFEAPEWRAQWVEKMEPGEQDAARSEPPTARQNEQEIERIIERNWEKVRAGDFAGAHEIYADDCVVEWPQSGERIRGKQNLLALREAYPTGVRFEMRGMTLRPGLCVSEYVIRYDGKPVNVVAIVEFEGAKIFRETHYFAEPFEAPGWRARWIERMEAPAAPE